MSRVVRNLAFCKCENEDADELCGNRKADQRLCFHYIDSTIPLPPIYEISSLYPSCVVVQPGLCGAWSETPKTGFLTTRLIYGICSNSLNRVSTTGINKNPLREVTSFAKGGNLISYFLLIHR